MSYQSSFLQSISDQKDPNLSYPNIENVYDRNKRIHNNQTEINTWEILDDFGSYEVNLDCNLVTSENPSHFAEFSERLFKVEVLSRGDIRDYCREIGFIPNEVRPVVWQLFLDYIPINKVEQNSVLKEKRMIYVDYIKEYYHAEMQESQLWQQIEKDVWRTHPEGFMEVFSHPDIVTSFIRLLFLWCSVNPDISYYQGLNEICYPFFVVFMSHCFGDVSDRHLPENKFFEAKSKNMLPFVEADVFWCVDAFISRMRQSHLFTNAGIYAESLVTKLEEVMKVVNEPLVNHIEELGLHFYHFSFRWMLCMMTREFSTKNLIQLWDTYILESDGFESLHVYFCAAFLNHLSEKCLSCTEFEDVLVLLQNPRSREWNWDTVKKIISRAKIIKDHIESTTL